MNACYTTWFKKTGYNFEELNTHVSVCDVPLAVELLGQPIFDRKAQYLDQKG